MVWAFLSLWVAFSYPHSEAFAYKELQIKKIAHYKALSNFEIIIASSSHRMPLCADWKQMSKIINFKTFLCKFNIQYVYSLMCIHLAGSYRMKSQLFDNHPHVGWCQWRSQLCRQHPHNFDSTGLRRRCSTSEECPQ